MEDFSSILRMPKIIYYRDEKGRIAKIPLRERFLSKVKKTSTCWIWTGRKFKNGYGSIRVGNKQALAHRVSYSLYVGALTDDLVVCHKCDNPSCVNPAHLFAGTQKENIQDMWHKGRQGQCASYGEKNGAAKLKEIDVIAIVKLRFEEKWKVAKIAEKFNVSKALVEKIIYQKIWIEVTTPLLAGYGILGVGHGGIEDELYHG